MSSPDNLCMESTARIITNKPCASFEILLHTAEFKIMCELLKSKQFCIHFESLCWISEGIHTKVYLRPLHFNTAQHWLDNNYNKYSVPPKNEYIRHMLITHIKIETE
jgi:hypothetical protein